MRVQNGSTELKDAIFFQRRLKPVDPGVCTFNPEEPRLPWADPLSQRRRLYEQVSQLKIVVPGQNSIAPDKRQRDLEADVLLANPKRTFIQIRRLLKLAPDLRFNLESNKRKDLIGEETAALLSKDEHFGPGWRSLTLNRQRQIVDRLLEEEDEQALAAWLQQDCGLAGEQAMTASILAPGVNPKLPYDPVKDFTHIARLGTASIMLVVANDFPAKSAPEFINVAQKAKEPIQYGTWGIGSTGHFCSEVLSQKYNFTLSHVVYRGTSPVVLALTSGELQVGFLDSVSGTTAVKSGKVRAIAACTRKMDHMPDVATYKDQGIDFDNWVGWSILGPAGIPDDIAKKLADAFKKTVEDPAMAARMRDWGITPEFVAGPEMAKAAAREIPEWKAIAAKANITIDQ